MRRYAALIGAGLALGGLAGPARGDDALRAARAAAREAEASVARQDWRGAARAIEAALAVCRGAENSRRCETTLLYARGYRLEAQAMQSPKRRQAYLAAASDAYAEALRLSPQNAAVSARLAETQQALGKRDAAIATLAPVVARRGSGWAARAQQLGDLQRAAGRMQEAVETYSALAASDPANAAARAGWVAALRRMPPDRAALSELAKQFEADGHPGLALELLELGLQRCDLQCGPEADEILLQWAALRASWGTVPETAALRLPTVEAWPSAARKGLDAIVDTPENVMQSPATTWWQSSWERRDVATHLVVARAATLRSDGEMERAIAALEAARQLAPARRGAGGGSYAFIDVSVQLAGLYAAAGREEDLEQLIRDLFRSKARHYVHEDRAGIQRLHTVLGVIFSEQKRYRSAWADNAVFQLEHALEMAEKRGDAQPLPDLRRRLAEAYVAEPSGPEDAGKARRLYTRATMEYLDEDDLVQAKRSLSKAGDSRESSELASVLAARESGARAVRVTRSPSGTPALETTYGWLQDGSTSALPADFLSRQRFKLLADGGREAALEGKRSDALYMQSLALTEAARTKPVSRLDASRLRAAERTIEGQSTVPREALDRSSLERLDRASPRQPVEIAPDTLRAAKLYSTPKVNSIVHEYDLVVEPRGADLVFRSREEPAPRAEPEASAPVLSVEPSEGRVRQPSLQERRATIEALRKVEGAGNVRFEAPSAREK